MTKSEGYKNLRENQYPAENGGFMVIVSKQALDEVLEEYDALQTRILDLEDAIVAALSLLENGGE